MLGAAGRLWKGFRILCGFGRDLLLPPGCVYCGKGLVAEENACGVLLCGNCLTRFRLVGGHRCRRCGREIVDNQLGETCPKCLIKPPRFDAVVTLGSYHGGLRGAVLRMKHPRYEPLTLAMGQLLWKYCGEQLAALRPDLVLPVPMHWSRRLYRGRNHAESLAAYLAGALNVPCRRRVLVRHRNTRLQSGITPAGRLRNVRGAFRVRQPEVVKEAKVLVVDDVLTTGATCGEIARVLKRAGATFVAVAVAARADSGKIAASSLQPEKSPQ